MRADKRRQTETRQTRSCNVVLKNSKNFAEKSTASALDVVKSLRRSKVGHATARTTTAIITANAVDTVTAAPERQQQQQQHQKQEQHIQSNRPITRKTKTPTLPSRILTRRLSTLFSKKGLPSNVDTVVTKSPLPSSEASAKQVAPAVRLPKVRKDAVESPGPKKPQVSVRLSKIKDEEVSAAAKKAVKSPTLPVATTTSQNQKISENLTKQKSVTEAATTKTIAAATTTTTSRLTPTTKNTSVATKTATPSIDETSKSESGAIPKSGKMYKQGKHVALTAAAAASQPPPTIAASRSRRSIKPNPKYASEDIVTPKYVAAIASDSPSVTHNKKSAYARNQHQARMVSSHNNDDDGDDFFNKDTEDFIDEDDDDDMADEAFDPRTQNSDDDDEDEDDLSDMEMYGNEISPAAKDKPVVKRRPGRPAGKTATTASSVKSGSAAFRANSATSGNAQRAGSSTKTAPTQLQQLRRTMAMNVPRVNLGSAVANKRKLALDEAATESQVPRKRYAIGASNATLTPTTTTTVSSSTDGSGKRIIVRRPMPFVNGGANRGNSTPSSTLSTKLLMSGPRPALSTAAQSSVKARATIPYQIPSKVAADKSPTMPPNRVSARVAVRPQAGGLVSAVTASTIAKMNLSKKQEAAAHHDDGDDTHTFTIVNIDDIMNQDDVLISKSAATTSSGGSAAGSGPQKKSLSGKSGAAGAPDAASARAANNTYERIGGTATKRQPFVTRGSTQLAAARQQPGTFAPRLLNNHKPAPRILNSEVGKKTQSMKPLMNMVDDLAKDLRPVLSSDRGYELEDDDILNDAVSSVQSQTTSSARMHSMTAQRMPPRRTIYHRIGANNVTQQVASTTTATPITAKKSSNNVLSAATPSTLEQKRRLATLLSEDDGVDGNPINSSTFKRPITAATIRMAAHKPTETKENSLASFNQRGLANLQHTPGKFAQHKLAMAAATSAASLTTTTTTTTTTSSVAKAQLHPQQPQPLSLPPESTTVRCEGGRVIRKVTCYETWYVISLPKQMPHVTRCFLEIPLVKLANVCNRIKLPSNRWSSKVTLYKLSPASMIKQTVVIYTGDLKSHNIPEVERHKYQPSCVLFRRAVTDRNRVRLPYDRAIIFKNKSFYTNIDGKHVHLIGAPETISTAKEVETLLDIVDGLTLKSSLVELITLK